MIRLSLLISVLLIGLSMALAKNQWQFRHLQKQLSRNNQQSRIVRNLMGKLIDTDTNTIYTVDGQKQEDKPSNSDATTSPTTIPSAAVPKLVHALPNLEETACIAACHACIEDYTLETRKKRAADNCGPMCDCADSCLLTSAEEVGQVYGQNSNIINDKNCWWRTYTEILSSGLPSLS